MDKNEQRRLEREKRQARIRASGGNRLTKITSVAGTQDFKPPVETPKKAPATAPAVASAPPANSPAGSREVESSMTDGRAANGLAPESDPLLAMLASMHQSQAGGSPAAGAAPPSAPGANAQAQAQQRSTSRVNVEYVWNFAYFATSIALGLYAARVNPWAVARLFMAVQVAMLGVRVFLGHHNHGVPMVSMLAPFLGMLPANRKRQLGVVAGLIGALRLAYWSFAVTVFVYGLASGGGSEFVRPA